MPRISNNEYLEHHRAVHQVWQHLPETFIVLTPAQQWSVHDSYQSQSGADDAELLQTRDELTRERPSLPQAAGRAYAQLHQCFRIASDYSEGDSQRFRAAINALAAGNMARAKSVGVTVGGLVQPTVDAEGLARAFIYALEEQL